MSVNLLSDTGEIAISVNPLQRTKLVHDLLDRAVNLPVESFLAHGGKRIRAELVEIAYQLAGGNGTPPWQLIDFMELLHAGSLAIDDIQDNSACRRGRRSLHIEHGVPLAINAGNWMYFSALEQLMHAGLGDHQTLETLKRAVTVIRKCHEGQALDLSARFDEIPKDSVVEVVCAISLWKTGALTGLATWLGAVAAGASPKESERIRLFGEELGVGLQMQNDYIELHRSALFQLPSDDLINRRVTWPWAWLSQSLQEPDYKCLVRSFCQSTIDQDQLAQRIRASIRSRAAEEIHQKFENSARVLGCSLGDSLIRERLNRLIAKLEQCYV